MAHYRARRRNPSKTTAAEDYEFFLDSFLELYREHADLLRFNQFFNVYVRAERIAGEQLHSYDDMIGTVRGRFHAIREKCDGTLRADTMERIPPAICSRPSAANNCSQKWRSCSAKYRHTRRVSPRADKSRRHGAIL